MRMIRQTIKTWKKLGLKQKCSLVGLLLLAVAMPASIGASFIETHLASRASDNTYITKTFLRQKTLLPRVQISPIMEKKVPPLVSADCRIGGCNGELCLGINDPQIESACVLREYDAAAMICRKTYATCELQASGTCGWNFDPKYEACLSNPPNQAEIVITGTAMALKRRSSEAVCGNNSCEPGENNSRECTAAYPPQCKEAPGTCPSDCEHVQPTGPDSCNLHCDANELLDLETCSCYSQTIPESTTEVDDEEVLDYCALEGGTLTPLKGCGDSCDILTDQLVACPAGDATPSCDCGPHACWNSTTCVKNPRTALRKNRLSVFGFQSWFNGVNSFFDSFFK